MILLAEKTLWSITIHICKTYPEVAIAVIVGLIILIPLGIMAIIGAIKICEDPEVPGSIHTPWGDF